ncbi:MAG: SusC/RagA family TonB-linked outer membrane protein, partial [Nitrospiraceae bacterium]|nr:SusC/RagA family TonB-linked outer membrane protein [Nitrospiraceae bacterium]
MKQVVVTALGIRKQERALGYSVSVVSGDEMAKAREINFTNSLAGKVAGVNVSSMASGPAGSNRVIIRGNSSLSGNNQPLYVVDGIPIDNSQLGNAGMWGGYDRGQGIGNLSSDDIESVSVLKGNAAAALYGSRASNGVILITTKSGHKRKGVGIEFSSNYVSDNIIDYTDFQHEYGSGDRGLKPTSKAEALDDGAWVWGEKLDGSDVIQFDGVARPYSYVGNNAKRFYRTGSTWTNNLALSGGNDVQTYRFSMTDLRNNSIVPNSGMSRDNISLQTNGQYGKRLTLSARIEYVYEKVKNRAYLSDSPKNANYAVFSLPPNVNVENLKGTSGDPGRGADGNELLWNGNVFATNPYFATYQVIDNDNRNRVLGSVLLKYQFTDWLYLQGRMGRDFSEVRSIGVEPYGLAYSIRGGMGEENRKIVETNADAMLGWDHNFGNNIINFNGFIGLSSMVHKYEHLYLGGNKFYFPSFYNISNLQNQTRNMSVQEHGINSFYGSAEVSYKKQLYLDGTVRKDWFSTLDGRGVLYPSVSLSWVFSDAFNMPAWFSFGKIRASWAQVGGGANRPYQTALSYRLVGQGHLGMSVESISQGSVPNKNLTPYTSNENELGLNIRLFNNRIGVDFDVYNRKTEDDIVSATISHASGYNAATVNLGEITNKGVELLVNAGIVRHHAFKWDVTFNYANNKNEVVKLNGEIKTMIVDQSRNMGTYIANMVGYPYSEIYGYTYRTDAQGRRVYDASGLPMRSTDLQALGTGVCPTTMGLNNSFTYKNFNLSFLIDMKAGGSIYSATNAYAYVRGLHKNTLVGRASGIDVSGVDESGAEFSHHIDANNVQDYYHAIYHISEQFVYDASFVKLRQFVLGYNLPAGLVNKTPFEAMNISLVGRNLLLLWSKTENIDPESTFSNGNAQGLEMFGVPPIRSFGINLNVKF